MKHGLSKTLAQTDSPCLIIGVLSDENLPDLSLPEASSSLIQSLKSKLQEPLDSICQAEHEGKALCLVNLGTAKDYQADALPKLFQAIAKLLLQQHWSEVTLVLPRLKAQSADWQLEQMIVLLEQETYQFLRFKTKKNKPHALKSVTWVFPEAEESNLKTGSLIAEALSFTRDLANLPANICTPTYLSKVAHDLDHEFDSVHVKALDLQAMEDLGMGALLAVAQGSAQAPQLITLKYTGQGSSPPVVFVGKGITFDSGGISLKPPEAMEEMKYDMCGAATVLGLIRACATLALPINVIGLLACAENLPSGTAVKPGDVVTSLSGQTIEIVNTDAEGRLVLADALTYAKQFHPKFVIDIATLTGAIVIALGAVNSGLMTNDESLAQLILSASAQSGDKVWRMPLDPAYQDLIASPVADIINSTGSRAAGSITAACFLSRFTEAFPWAHLDIAGTAWISGKDRNATGRPLRLLLQCLRQVIQDAH